MMTVRGYALAFSAALMVGCGGSGGSNDGGVIAPPPTAATPTISTQAVFTNLSFTQPVALMQAPADSSQWYVVEKSGIVRVFANDENTLSTSVFIDIRGAVNTSGEGGLLGMAFDPDYPIVPEVYLSFTRSGSPLVSYVSRFTLTNNGLTLNPASEEVILTVAQPDDNHNGGDLAFGPDGYLYIGLGDGGGSGDPGGNGQKTNTLMGAILRLDIVGGSPYGIPAGNPFETEAICTGVARTESCPEIYAWGLRNPWRFSFDTVTSKLWVGDVGQGDWEEVDVITAGGNYGWNQREGAHCFSPAVGCENTFVEPITEYDHTLGRSITGGFVYRGSAIPDMVGWYVFGDFSTGRLFGIREGSPVGVTPEVFGETGLQIVSFGQSDNGELYVLHFGGTIHQITDAP